MFLDGKPALAPSTHSNCKQNRIVAAPCADLCLLLHRRLRHVANVAALHRLPLLPRSMPASSFWGLTGQDTAAMPFAFAGGSVGAAGAIAIYHGRILKLAPLSGHYTPDLSVFLTFLDRHVHSHNGSSLLHRGVR